MFDFENFLILTDFLSFTMLIGAFGQLARQFMLLPSSILAGLLE